MPQRSSAARPLIVALDIGTSSTRALLYDSHGRLQPGREVQIKYRQTVTPDGGVYCDPDRLLHDTISALKRLIRDCDRTQKLRIAAVACSCFWHALMGVGADGHAATPLYSWADTRSETEVGHLKTLLPPEVYHERSGAFLHSSYWPAKIAWLRRTDPQLAGKVAHWLSFPDYMALRLAGRLTTSVSLASGSGLLDESSDDWDNKTLSILAIKSQSLPQIACAGESLRLADKGAIPGLPDVPWFPAYGDGACSNIGAGGIDESRVVINVSTSGAIRVLCPKPSRPVPHGLFRYRLDERRWVIGGAMSNGGNGHVWLRDTLKLGDDNAALDRKLRLLPPAAHGLTVMPFWAGERSPGWRAGSRAAIVGMNLSTTPIEIAQAAMESVAYTFRSQREDILAAFPGATNIIVSGGAVEHSLYLRHLLADVMGAPVRLSLDAEPSGRGAALAVAEAIGVLSSIEHSPDRLSRPIEPDCEATKTHDRAYERFLSIYDTLIAKA